jgi:hypothetical protein
VNLSETAEELNEATLSGKGILCFINWAGWAVVRQCILHQEKEDQQVDQLNLFNEWLDCLLQKVLICRFERCTDAKTSGRAGGCLLA